LTTRSHRIKFYYYAIISIVGLLISVITFYLAQSSMNISVFYANWIGDLIALIFVFFCSWLFIFDHSKQKISIKFIFNLVGKLLVIYLISTTLYVISNLLDSSILAKDLDGVQRVFIITCTKVLLAPVSLLANYFLTFIIIEKLYKE